MYFNMIQF